MSDRAVQYDNLALQKLSDFSLPPIAWTGSSISPSSIRMILNEVNIHKRKRFIEFGGGVSTFYLAEMARRCNGSLVCIEQDKAWLEILTSLLQEANLMEYVQLYHIETIRAEHGERMYDWYNADALKEALQSQLFDLVLVDAPISTENTDMIRYPAGPCIQNYLMDDFCVFLDDSHRKGEQKIADLWVSELGWEHRSVWPKASCAYFKPKGNLGYNIC